MKIEGLSNWLYAWMLLGGFVGGAIQLIYAWTEIDVLSFNAAFWFARTFYENNCNQLNRAGLIIGIAFISILVLPGSILIIAVSSFIKLLNMLWSLFKYVFKRRNKIPQYERPEAEPIDRIDFSHKDET